jgi:hypothetical protein
VQATPALLLPGEEAIREARSTCLGSRLVDELVSDATPALVCRVPRVTADEGSPRQKLYYAGQSGSVADTGLAYMEPE